MLGAPCWYSLRALRRDLEQAGAARPDRLLHPRSPAGFRPYLIVEGDGLGPVDLDIEHSADQIVAL